VAHSSFVGGSNAERFLNCAGAWQAIMALPKAVDISSEFALEGSAMHVVMKVLMHEWKLGVPFGALWETAGNLIDRTFGEDNRVLTLEDVETMIWPALEVLGKLMDQYGAGYNFEVLAIERSVDFPGIPGSHGTVDLIIGNASCVIHLDWKFGQGVGVKATYAVENGEIINPQLMFYTAGAINSAPGFYKAKKKLVVAIVQPRGSEPLTHTEVTRKEIKWFIADMHVAAVRALKHDWCRWAPCKVNCPLWTAPMLELAVSHDKVMAREEMVTADPSPYGQYLARAKNLTEQLAIFKTELDKQLHAYLEDGGSVPGWRLKAKAKQRQWIDESAVYYELEALGFRDEDIWQAPELQTFSHTDAVAKRLGVEIPSILRQAPPTNETTVCRTDDPAPEVTKPLAVEKFRAALADLMSKKTA
jgi:hypothetical protein